MAALDTVGRSSSFSDNSKNSLNSIKVFMSNEVKIQEVRMLTSVLVTYTDVDGRPQTEMFYYDIMANNVKYVATPTLPVPEYLKSAIIQYVGQRTPSVPIPNMPEKPAYDAESFTQL